MLSPAPLSKKRPCARTGCDAGATRCDATHDGVGRDHGVKQFVSRYRKVEGIENDELKWGDEVRKNYPILL